MKRWQSIFGGLSALAIVISGYGSLMVSAAWAAPAPDQGMIVVTLSQNPASKAIVTATRQAAVPGDITTTGQPWGPEKVTLAGGSGAKATNMGYTSPILKYTFSAGSGCRNDPQPYDMWKIEVSGSATANPKIVSVICGATVSVPMTVVLPKDAAKYATLSGISSFAGTACDSGVSGGVGSQYWLVKPGTSVDAKGVGKGLSVTAANKAYTINNLTPGTYDFFVDCVYRPNGATTPVDHFFTQTGVVLTAGTVTKVDFTDATAGGPGATNAVPTCDVGSLSFLVCPLISLGQTTVTYLEGIVKDQLKFTPLSSEVDAGLKPAWTVFRNLADAFFVLIFFIVIFGTSLGLDNYTVKKILPRLIAAAVLIQFSYVLVGFMVDISNVLGVGIDSLMAAATHPGTHIGNSGVTQAAGVVEALAIVSGAIAVNAFFALGLAIPLLLMIGSAVLGILAVLITLQIRIIIIDILIVIGPLAILLWVLPNTEKYFNMWRETLIKLLLMFPIIALLFAVANLISIVLAPAGAAASDSQKLLASLAPILAFFMVPATFKFAGSAMMAGSSFVGKHAGRGKSGISGAQDKMKQNRAYNRQQKGLGKINALNEAGPAAGAFGRAKQSGQRRLAQHQAGLSLDKIQDSRIQGALLSNDKTQQDAFGRQYKTLTPEAVEGILASTTSSQNERKAAATHLAQHSQENHIAAARVVAAHAAGANSAGVFDESTTAGKAAKGAFDTSWSEILGGNYSDLNSKAPHAVKGMPALEKLTAAQNASAGSATRADLAAYAITGKNQPARTRLLENLDMNSKSVAVRQSWNSETAKVLYDTANAVGGDKAIGASADDQAYFKAISERLDSEGRLIEFDKSVPRSMPTGPKASGPNPAGGGAPSGGGSPAGGGSSPSGGGGAGGNSGGSAGGGSTSSGGDTSTSRSYTGGGTSTQNMPFSPNSTLDPNLVQQRSGVTNWGNSAEGLIIPSSALNPTAAPSRPSASQPNVPSTSQPTVSSSSVKAKVTIVAAANDSSSPASVPASDFVPSRIVNPAQSISGNEYAGKITVSVPASPAANPTTQTQAVAQPTITTTATTYGGDSKNPANVFLPQAAGVPQPGSRTTPPKPSLRLAPRDLTDEPGDDRSIS